MALVKIVSSLGFALVLLGCAPMTPATFRLDGVSQDQYLKDNYACERDARNIAGGDCRQMDLYERCMESKGYTAVPGTAQKRMCQ